MEGRDGRRGEGMGREGGEERGQSALHKACVYLEQRVEWNVRRPGNST